MSDLTASATPSPLLAGMVRCAAAIADRAVISDIELHALRVAGQPGERLYDLRPMLDEREHCDASLDLAREALAYAHARGLIAFDRGERWLARITR